VAPDLDRRGQQQDDQQRDQGRGRRDAEQQPAQQGAGHRPCRHHGHEAGRVRAVSLGDRSPSAPVIGPADQWAVGRVTRAPPIATKATCLACVRRSSVFFLWRVRAPGRGCHHPDVL
jgi:hypothetical protein